MKETLTGPAQKGLDRIAKLYRSKGYDLYITSIKETAFAFRYASYVSADEIRDELGPDWDVVPEIDHIHAERDPK